MASIFDSPIEESFANEIIKQWGGHISEPNPDDPDDGTYSIFCNHKTLWKKGVDLVAIEIQPCIKFGRITYRPDFVFVLWHSENKKSLSIIIELDGFDYHDRNKIQFEYERKRERTLRKDGLEILRFAGTEIKRNPKQILDEITDFIIKRFA